MEVNLLTWDDMIGDMEHFAECAALTCRDNFNKALVASGILKRIIKLGHESILEHITLTYSVKWLSRAVLQELARHRHISLSVESTRHTLQKILSSDKDRNEYRQHVNKKYHAVFDNFVSFAKEHSEIPNDELKYYLPEFWPTNLIMTANVRELRHIIKLRTAPAALKEFQDLAQKLFEAVPDEFKYLLEDCVYKKGE